MKLQDTFAVTTAVGTLLLSHAANAAEISSTIEEVIVTASKRPENIQDVPSAITALSGAALEENGASRLADYLNSAPSVSLRGGSNAGRNSIAIRGVNSGPSQAGSSVGLYVDDTPFGSSTVFTVSAALTPDIDPFDLERIEILRGPQGTLYGANTLGGLLKFVTKSPDLDEYEVGARLQAVSTADDEGYLIGARLNAPLVRDKFAIRMSGSYRQDPGFIDNLTLGQESQNEVRTTSARLSALLLATDNLSFKLNYFYQDIDSLGANYVLVNPQTLQPLYGDLKTRALLEEPSATTFNIVSGVASYDFGGLNLTSITSYADTDSEVRRDYSPDFQPAFGTTAPIAGDFHSKTEKVTEELRLSSDASKPLSFIAGAFYTHEDSAYIQALSATDALGDILTGSPLERILRNNQVSTYEEYAGFGNLTYAFSKAFDVTLGARYTKIDHRVEFRRSGLIGFPSNPSGVSIVPVTASEDVTTYMANARWHIDPDKMLYVRVASGYRPGGPRNLPPVPLPPGISTTFDADTVWNYEVGTKTTWLDGAATINFSAFRIDWDDIQLTQAIQGFSLLSNGGRARSEGFELETIFRPTTQLTLRANGAYTDAKLRDDAPSIGGLAGDKLPLTAPWQFSLDANYSFNLSSDWNGAVGAAYIWQDERPNQFSAATPAASRVTLPSYDTIDLRASASYKNGLEVSAFVRNVADERAITSVEVAAVARSVLIMPRTFGLALAKSF